MIARLWPNFAFKLCSPIDDRGDAQFLTGEVKAAMSLTRSAWRLVSVLVKIRPLKT